MFMFSVYYQDPDYINIQDSLKTVMNTDLQSIRSPIDSSAALIWTLVDVGQLFSENSIQIYDII